MNDLEAQMQRMVDIIKAFKAKEPRRYYSWRDNPLNGTDINLRDKFNDNLRLDQALWLLDKSPSMRALKSLCKGKLEGVKVTAETMKDKFAGAFLMSTKDIELSNHPKYSLWFWTSVLAHEYRHFYHDEYGIFDFLDGCLCKRQYKCAAFTRPMHWRFK